MSENKIKRSFIAYVIEQSMFEYGGEIMIKKTIETLKQRHDATIPDCYEHPEYLHKSLHDLYGKSAQEIIKTIQSNLKEFDYQEPIHNFIKKICSDPC